MLVHWLSAAAVLLLGVVQVARAEIFMYLVNQKGKGDWSYLSRGFGTRWYNTKLRDKCVWQGSRYTIYRNNRFYLHSMPAKMRKKKYVVLQLSYYSDGSTKDKVELLMTFQAKSGGYSRHYNWIKIAPMLGGPNKDVTVVSVAYIGDLSKLDYIYIYERFTSGEQTSTHNGPCMLPPRFFFTDSESDKDKLLIKSRPYENQEKARCENSADYSYTLPVQTTADTGKKPTKSPTYPVEIKQRPPGDILNEGEKTTKVYTTKTTSLNFIGLDGDTFNVIVGVSAGACCSCMFLGVAVYWLVLKEWLKARGDDDGMMFNVELEGSADEEEKEEEEQEEEEEQGTETTAQ